MVAWFGGRRSAASWRCSAIHQMNTVNSRNGLWSWWQHYKYRPGIIIIIIIRADIIRALHRGPDHAYWKLRFVAPSLRWWHAGLRLVSASRWEILSLRVSAPMPSRPGWNATDCNSIRIKPRSCGVRQEAVSISYLLLQYRSLAFLSPQRCLSVIWAFTSTLICRCGYMFSERYRAVSLRCVI